MPNNPDGLFGLPDGPHYPSGRPMVLSDHLREIERDQSDDWTKRYRREARQIVGYEYRQVGKHLVILNHYRDGETDGEKWYQAIRSDRCRVGCVRGALLQQPDWIMVDSLAIAAATRPYLPRRNIVVTARCRETWTYGSVCDLVRVSWEFNRYITVSSPGHGAMGDPSHAHAHLVPYHVGPDGGKEYVPFGLARQSARRVFPAGYPDAVASVQDWPCLALGLSGPPSWRARSIWRLMESAEHKDYSILITPDGPSFWLPRKAWSPESDPRAPKAQRGSAGARGWGSSESAGCILCTDPDVFTQITEESIDEALEATGVCTDIDQATQALLSVIASP